MPKENLYYATGKRKNAIARTWLKPGTGEITVNNRPVEDYFPIETMRTDLVAPFKLTNTIDAYNVKVNVHGGGISGQAGAVRHGITKALILADPDLRMPLKSTVKREPGRDSNSPNVKILFIQHPKRGQASAGPLFNCVKMKFPARAAFIPLSIIMFRNTEARHKWL
jgi:small subunit ribosomal protein S9